MVEPLAPLFVNDARVRVQGDPKPMVAKIVRAAGKDPQDVQVYRLETAQDPTGNRIGVEDIIDRTADPNPVFLRCLERPSTADPGVATGPSGPAPPKETSGGERRPKPLPTGGPSPPMPGPHAAAPSEHRRGQPPSKSEESTEPAE